MEEVEKKEIAEMTADCLLPYVREIFVRLEQLEVSQKKADRRIDSLIKNVDNLRKGHKISRFRLNNFYQALVTLEKKNWKGEKAELEPKVSQDLHLN